MIDSKRSAARTRRGISTSFRENRVGLHRDRTVREDRRLLKDSPHLAPWWPAVGIAPQLTDTELVALAMTQAMLGFTAELGGSVTPVPDGLSIA
nr:hypothetical protein [Streptomyces sp. CB03578]